MSVTQNNVYVHSSPPKAISSSGAAIRQLVKNGDLDKLEAAVLDGQGARLLGLAETTPDAKVKQFLRSVPGLMAKVDLIHDAVIRGSVKETQTLLDKKKLAAARDAVGRGLAHKAVLHSNKSVIEWLGKKYPEVLNIRDNESRTCLHYAAACRDPEEMYDFLVSLGSNPELADIHGRKPEYYIKHPDEFDIEGPTRSLSRGKRRKISPTAATPPRKIMSSPLSITRAQIRILIHERDIPKLEKIVWSGHGEKLLLETTNNSKVRRFLDNVPHLLSRIKSIHTAAINNDVEFLKDVRKRTELSEVFTAKDSHGLTPLHKAAGLSNRAVLEYLIYEVPSLIHEPDNEGHVPLHFAAKDPNVYNWIVKAGGNENVTDQKGKTPGYYKNHQSELDTRYIRNIPDAPRVSGDISGWDRSSPVVNAARRRPSNGEFGTFSRDDSGKYGLSDNLELREEEFVVNDSMESDYQPRIPSTKQNGIVTSTEDDFEDETPTEAYAPPVAAAPVAEKLRQELDKVSAGSIRQSAVEAVLPIPVSMQQDDVRYEPDTEVDTEDLPTAPDIEFIDNEVRMEDPDPPGRQESIDLDYNYNEREREMATTEPEQDVGAELEPEPEPEAETIEDAATSYAGGSTKYLESGTDIEIALKNRNMETLVDMILDGRGAELLNQKTEHPDLKEFLSNVPAYMAKMHSIHKAAASGNLRDLQALLDRKRLALAKDELGRSPLHQAVLFNHNNVARHLASTYPQSLRALDSNGRSPLHYAATLSDSGTLYKYLVNLGADPNVKDVNGNTPGIYLRNRDLLSNKDLINAGGMAGIAAESAVEKVTALTARSAGVKGVPEEVPEDRWERPETPPVAALSALETFYNSHIVNVETLWTRAWRRLSSHNGNPTKFLMKKFLTPDVFNQLKLRQTRNGCTLLDAIKFYPQYFLVAPDPESYYVFRELFYPAIEDNNRIAVGEGVDEFFLGNEILPQAEIPPVDIPSKFVRFVRMRLSRNIKPYPLLPVMKKDEICRVANAMKIVQMNWPCFDLETLDKEIREGLKRRCWIPEASSVSRFWPKCRYFLLSHDNNAQVWMNAEDHLTVLVTSPYGKLYPMLETLNDVYLQYATSFEFYKLKDIGYVTVDPFQCGSALRITFRIRLPTLMRDRSELATLAAELNLSLKWKNSSSPPANVDNIAPDDWVELENKTTLGLNEIDLCKQIVESINRIIGRAAAIANGLETTPVMSDHNQRFPAIWSEEGKYLASVLGDALVKGLTQVSQERPADPVEYLANFLKDYHRESGGAASAKPPPPRSGIGMAMPDMPVAAPAPLSSKSIKNLNSSAKSAAKSASLIGLDAEAPPDYEDDLIRDEDAELEQRDGARTQALEVVTQTINGDDAMTPDSEDEDNIRKLDDEVEIAEDDPNEEEEDNQAQQMRDEHGQSVLHLASSRPGGAHTIFAFLQNPSVNLAWRDENLKTCRDVAYEMSRSENLQTIDSYIVSLAVQGNLEGLQRLLYDGYDHLTDIKDSVHANIIDAVSGQPEIVTFLKSIDGFLDKLEKLHNAVRAGKIDEVKKLCKEDPKLVSTMGPFGRTALHLAVLMEDHAIVQYMAQDFPEALKRGDHLERMPLHYAMGIEKVEKMTRVLVRAGARRVVKDLRGRQPSYYFINREEIAIMQEDEEMRRNNAK